ncbi:MAG: lipid-A-disaccharide synthase [Planctomycetota bacterium]|nr:lipid-A-disaccharide synthase [Planctomycetota bacterium]
MGHPRIFLSAGETSGDLHASNLIRAIRRQAPDAEIVALGGPKMEAAGARLLANTVEFGIIGVGPILGGFTRYLALLSRADRFVGAWRPDVAVTIDCPGFHFLLASRLRARRIPTLWYIPPQLWAWAPWRVHKLRRRFTHVACVLPHEEAFFREHGVPVTFVGHPVVDHLRGLALDQPFIRSLRTTAKDRVVILMPGSRRQEVVPILRRQLAVARALADRHPPCSFVLALAHEEHRAWVAPLTAASGLPIRTVVGKTHEVQSTADLALAKSGTTTLELLFYEKPMAVFYNMTWAQWHLLVRWLVRTPWLTLPNALAGRRIVPEYMRDGPPTAEQIDEVASLLTDERRRTEVRTALADVRRRIDVPGAAERAAGVVLNLVGTRVPAPPAMRPGFAM